MINQNPFEKYDINESDVAKAILDITKNQKFNTYQQHYKNITEAIEQIKELKRWDNCDFICIDTKKLNQGTIYINIIKHVESNINFEHVHVSEIRKQVIDERKKKPNIKCPVALLRIAYIDYDDDIETPLLNKDDVKITAGRDDYKVSKVPKAYDWLFHSMCPKNMVEIIDDQEEGLALSRIANYKQVLPNEQPKKTGTTNFEAKLVHPKTKIIIDNDDFQLFDSAIITDNKSIIDHALEPVKVDGRSPLLRDTEILAHLIACMDGTAVINDEVISNILSKPPREKYQRWADGSMKRRVYNATRLLRGLCLRRPDGAWFPLFTVEPLDKPETKRVRYKIGPKEWVTEVTRDKNKNGPVRYSGSLFLASISDQTAMPHRFLTTAERLINCSGELIYIKGNTRLPAALHPDNKEYYFQFTRQQWAYACGLIPTPDTKVTHTLRSAMNDALENLHNYLKNNSSTIEINMEKPIGISQSFIKFRASPIYRHVQLKKERDLIRNYTLDELIEKIHSS